MANRPMVGKAERIIAITVAAAVVIAVAVGSAFRFNHDMVERFIANHVTGVGGPFSLVDQDGRPFTRDDLLGRPHVLYFGFTLCPDLCPTTLFQIAGIVEALGDRARPLEVVFVSVDPEHDTPQVLRDYVGAFHDGFVGLTGTAEALAEAARAYRIYYRKVALDDGSYTMDHTASAMLFNADGSFAGSIAYDEAQASAYAKIERLLGENAGT